MNLETFTHGTQGEPAAANLLDEETGEGSLAPSIPEVVGIAKDVITRIMLRGSNKSAFGQWFSVDSRRYSADRCISHLAQAMMQLDGSRAKKDANGEDAIDHLERALVRLVFVLCKTKKGKID